MMNGNFTLVTVPGMGEKKIQKKVLPKVLPMANWKRMPIGSVDIHSIGFYWIFGLA